MVKSLTKVVYKPESTSTEEYSMIVDAEQYKKWKGGDTSIPLTDVVESFKIFHSNQGKQGHLGEASRQQLENLFGTSKDIDCAQQLLSKGSAQAGDGFKDDKIEKNILRGDYRMDTKGSGARLTGS